MIEDAFGFGAHAPFVLAAYAATFIVIAGLIISRRNKLKKAQDAERTAAMGKSENAGEARRD